MKQRDRNKKHRKVVEGSGENTIGGVGRGAVTQGRDCQGGGGAEEIRSRSRG